MNTVIVDPSSGMIFGWGVSTHPKFGYAVDDTTSPDAGVSIVPNGSVAVPFASNRWGSLASMGAQPGPGTKRWYGTTGNSFIAIVEFGPKPRAIALTAGGLSNNPASRHFADQLARYPGGALRPVYFDAADLAGHIERRYRPGQ